PRSRSSQTCAQSPLVTVDRVRQTAMCSTAQATERWLIAEIPIIKQIGAEHVAAIELAGIVGFYIVERNQRSAATTFDRRGITALVRHEMLERSQKKGTQAALFLSDRLEIFPLQNEREKLLGEIFRLL